MILASDYHYNDSLPINRRRIDVEKSVVKSFVDPWIRQDFYIALIFRRWGQRKVLCVSSKIIAVKSFRFVRHVLSHFVKVQPLPFHDVTLWYEATCRDEKRRKRETYFQTSRNNHGDEHENHNKKRKTRKNKTYFAHPNNLFSQCR